MVGQRYTRARTATSPDASALAVVGALGALGTCLLAAPTAAHAQREQFAARLEFLGPADPGAGAELCPLGRDAACLAARALDGQRVTASSVQVGASWRRFVGKSGNTSISHGVLYRGLRLNAPLVAVPAPPSMGVIGEQFVGGPRHTWHVLAYDFQLLHSLSEKTSLLVFARPGLYTSGRGIDLSHFRPEGAVVMDRVVGEKTTVGGGLSYASAFGRVLPIPLLHVVHVASPKVLVDVLLPSRADVWWYPRKGLEVGLNASLTGAQYAVGRTFVPVNASQLMFANATVGPQVRWNVAGKWYASLDAGTTVLRRVQFGTAGGDVRLDYAPGNVGFVRAGVARNY